jgi:hypothetical protein
MAKRYELNWKRKYTVQLQRYPNKHNKEWCLSWFNSAEDSDYDYVMLFIEKELVERVLESTGIDHALFRALQLVMDKSVALMAALEFDNDL